MSHTAMCAMKRYILKTLANFFKFSGDSTSRVNCYLSQPSVNSSHSYTLVCTFKLGNCTTCNLQALCPMVSTDFPHLVYVKSWKNCETVYSVLNNLIFFHLLLLTELRLFTILFRSSELIAQLRSENIKLREKLEETEEKLEVIWKTVY